jgi:hypothetical protein
MHERVANLGVSRPRTPAGPEEHDMHRCGARTDHTDCHAQDAMHFNGVAQKFGRLKLPRSLGGQRRLEAYVGGAATRR